MPRKLEGKSRRSRRIFTVSSSSRDTSRESDFMIARLHPTDLAHRTSASETFLAKQIVSKLLDDRDDKGGFSGDTTSHISS